MASELAQMVNDILAGGFDLTSNLDQALSAYDGSSITAMLMVNDPPPEELAFSSAAGESGNNVSAP